MKIEFTKQEILSNRGCYSREQVENLSFINNEIISIHNILESEISIKDKRWFVYNNCELTLDEKKKLCLQLAWVVFPIYEEKYLGDNRVKDCLQAIEYFYQNKISIEELREKRAAAYAAAADADPADAAAYAAAAAAYADADPAAAAYAAYAADAADADADAYAADDKLNKLTYSQKLQQLLIDFF